MNTKRNRMRAGIAVLGVGAVVAATILPGTVATAEGTGEPYTAVTRAVLSQGDTNGEISRATLITQIQVDGKGQTSFSVPVPDGGSPKDMDSFGGPEVEDGSAQYSLDVDGPQTQRTSQDYSDAELPVTIEVSATLDGVPVEPSELAGATGLATLSYTLSNHTAESTEVSYEDAAGDTVTETLEIPTPMAGTLDFDFDSSWNEVRSDQSDTVAQNGQGGTTVGATVALMAPPAGETEATVTVEGRVENAVVPPADIKVAIIDPLETGAGQSGEELAKKTGGGLTTLYEGMETLSSPTEGLGALAKGLGAAVTGSDLIAQGVAGTLGPGIHELRLKASVGGHETAISASSDLVDQVRGQGSYQELLGGFDTLNSDDALFKMQDTLLSIIPKISPPFTTMPVTNAGWPDMANATAPGSMNALAFGITKRSLGYTPPRSSAGLTNPLCDISDPQNANSPCGAVQVLDLALGQSAAGVGNPAGESGTGLSFDVPQACHDTLTDCVDPINGPGGSAVNELLPQIMVGENGYTGGRIGQDMFAGGLLDGASVLNLIQGHDFGSGVCDIPGWPNPSSPILVTCGGALDLQISKMANLAFLSGSFTHGLAEALGTGLKTDGSDSDGSSLRFALGKLRKGFSIEKNGWPTGCHPNSNSNKYFHDKYGCNLDAGDLGRGMLDDNKFTATNTLMALQVNLGKTDTNPGGQIGQGSSDWGSKLAFSKCPGPDNKKSVVSAHCSAAQVLTFTSAGIAGKDQVKVSEGKVASACPTVPSEPWIVPQNGSDKGTVPPAPDTDEVQRYGITCAVRTLQNSIDRILLPGIGNGVQESTLGLIGSGQFTPNCDPDVTGTLTCALSVLDYGVSGPQDDSLLNGTQTLADGLPTAEADAQAAADGVTEQMMPGVNSSVEEANQGLAVLESLSERFDSGASVPGGAAEGVDSNQGIYAFELAGAGGSVESSTARFGLALLLLLLAGGLGWFLSNRAT